MVNRYCGLPAQHIVGYLLSSFIPLQSQWPNSCSSNIGVLYLSSLYCSFPFCPECFPQIPARLSSSLPSDLPQMSFREIFPVHPIYNCSLSLLLPVPLSYQLSFFHSKYHHLADHLHILLCLLSVSPFLEC